jgi:hypothetical protein
MMDRGQRTSVLTMQPAPALLTTKVLQRRPPHPPRRWQVGELNCVKFSLTRARLLAATCDCSLAHTFPLRSYSTSDAGPTQQRSPTINAASGFCQAAPFEDEDDDLEKVSPPAKRMRMAAPPDAEQATPFEVSSTSPDSFACHALMSMHVDVGYRSFSLQLAADHE